MKTFKSKHFMLSWSIVSIVILQVVSVGGTFGSEDHIIPINPTSVDTITLYFNFSNPVITSENESIWVKVNETDLNMLIPKQPILPTNITVLPFEFGTEILSVNYTTSIPVVINLSKKLAHADYTPFDLAFKSLVHERDITTLKTEASPFPIDWISYHTGGGLQYSEHVSFMILRVYPVRYFSDASQLQFIKHINVTIEYKTPEEPLLQDHDIYDLLIVAPQQYMRPLKRLVDHKSKYDIKTHLVSVKEIHEQIYWQGRDSAEKIKYYIKNAIEYWGVTHVLLVGGLHGQTFKWDLPVRYSHVVPPDEQEYAEQSFISDIYYADIYDSQGEFQTWDTNQNNVFAEWKDNVSDDMDQYPDVYLGRLPCRTARELQIMVRKIIRYEKDSCDPEWFTNLLLVAGDSYNDINRFNEGVLISEAAIEVMPGFTPVKVYADNQDIKRRTVNKALNKGAGFAYFCGHGNPMSWTTHFPPDGKNWTTGYTVGDMIYLRNWGKLPITIVGGCHNGQFDVTLMNIIQGIKENGLKYFSSRPPAGRFWWNEWSPNCWAWWLTSKTNGGAIATIANTGLGTHGDGDLDNNEIADYLEVLDGWMELRFLQLYGEDHKDILGQNHGQTLTEYLHRFLGNNDKMDTKMVQQWELFGDPSLKIGGYP
jgi:hypothetical protein